jgi:hypothetical protein
VAGQTFTSPKSPPVARPTVSEISKRAAIEDKTCLRYSYVRPISHRRTIASSFEGRRVTQHHRPKPNPLSVSASPATTL